MTVSIASALQNALNESAVTPIHLIEMVHTYTSDNTTRAEVRVTDFPDNITHQSKTYYSNAGLVDIGKFTVSSDFSVNNYVISFAGPGTGLPEAFASWAQFFKDIYNTTLRVDLLIKHDGNLRGPLVMFRGTGAGVTVATSDDNAVPVSVTEWSSALARPEGTPRLIATDNHQQAHRDTSDDGLKYIHRSRDIIWGRT